MSPEPRPEPRPDARHRGLQQALALSHAVAAAAADGDVALALRLDAERAQVLQAARPTGDAVPADEHRLMEEMAALNAQAIGALQHRQRGIARTLDMLVTGQRAVRAYGATHPRR
jgi:hypothetical protein